MKNNMGRFDRVIRFLIAAGVVALYYFNIIEGALAYVLLAIAAIFLVTSIVGLCPLYTILGIRTCKVPKVEQ